jgi:hypothetical protein
MKPYVNQSYRKERVQAHISYESHEKSITSDLPLKTPQALNVSFVLQMRNAITGVIIGVRSERCFQKGAFKKVLSAFESWQETTIIICM